MMEPADTDKTNPGVAPVRAAEVEFADLLRHVLAEHDEKMEQRLEGIEKALKSLADAFLEFNQGQPDEAAWRRRADARFADLEVRVTNLERERAAE